MSERLAQALREKVTKEGMIGKGHLADLIGRTPRVIDFYIEGRSRPTQRNAYKLALACGLGEEAALSIAYECASNRANRTA